MTPFEKAAIRARIDDSVGHDNAEGFDRERHVREIFEVALAAKRPRDLYLDLRRGARAQERERLQTGA